MSEVFDSDLEAYLRKTEETICPECGHIAQFWEFEFGICPKCKTDINEDPNDEYEHEDKLFDI